MGKLSLKRFGPALLVIVLICSLSAFFGCATSPGATPTPAVIVSPTPAVSPTGSPAVSPSPGAPTISITKPAANSTVPPGNVTVAVKVSNFQLVNKIGQSPVPGQGHINYFLDFPPPTTPGQPANGTANVSWVATANTTYTFANVTLGNHTAYVELVNNNNTPLVPPVTANVTFKAGNVTPTPTPTPTSTATPTPTPTSTATVAPAASPTSTTSPAAGAYTIKTASSPALGTYLTDGKGRTLYWVTGDTKGKSNIPEGLTSVWPYFYTKDIVVPSSLTKSDFASITTYSQDQTTFKDWPLYYYVGDTAPGQTNGQGLNDAGGHWTVVEPDQSAPPTSGP